MTALLMCYNEFDKKFDWRTTFDLSCLVDNSVIN